MTMKMAMFETEGYVDDHDALDDAGHTYTDKHRYIHTHTHQKTTTSDRGAPNPGSQGHLRATVTGTVF